MGRRLADPALEETVSLAQRKSEDDDEEDTLVDAGTKPIGSPRAPAATADDPAWDPKSTGRVALLQSAEGRADEQSAGDGDSGDVVGCREWMTVVILCVITAFLFADQNLMAPNLTQIAKDFGFDEKQRDEKLGGEISMALFVLGGPVSLAAGWMTDKMPRKPLFLALILVGEGPCLATILVKNFNELLILRALTGVAIGGAMPLLFSFFGDIFSKDRRVLVSALVSGSMGIGVTLGQLISGIVGPHYGWRMPFVIVSAPAIIFTLLSMCVIKEPERGRTEAGLKDRFRERENFHYKERITAGKACGALTVTTNLMIFLQGIPGCLPWSLMIVFLNDYFAQEKGMSVEEATLVMTAINLGGMFGGFFGGVAGQWLYNWYRPAITWLMAAAAFIGIFPLVYLIEMPVPLPPMPTVLFMAVVTGFVSTIPAPNVRAIMLNVNGPETRGTTFAIYNLMDHLGIGIGPVLLVVFMEALGSRATAFNSAVIFGWIVCGIVFLFLGISIPADEDRLQEQLRSGEGVATCCFP